MPAPEISLSDAELIAFGHTIEEDMNTGIGNRLAKVFDMRKLSERVIWPHVLTKLEYEDFARGQQRAINRLGYDVIDQLVAQLRASGNFRFLGTRRDSSETKLVYRSYSPPSDLNYFEFLVGEDHNDLFIVDLYTLRVGEYFSNMIRSTSHRINQALSVNFLGKTMRPVICCELSLRC